MGDFVELRMMDLPGYMQRSQRQRDEHEAHIAHLDSTRILVRRDELGTHTDAFFDQMLADLVAELEASGDQPD